MFLQIDWTTLVFQFINFLVLVAILARFLFKPVLKIIEQRREEVQTRLDEAAKERADADKLKDEYNTKLNEAKSIAEQTLSEARKNAETERDNIIRKGEDYIKQRKEQTEKHLKHAEDQSLYDNRKEIADVAFNMSEHMLSSVADSNLNQVYVDKFIEKLRDLGDDEKHEIQDMGKTGATITSAYQLSDEQKSRISETLGIKSISFSEDQNLLAGASLRAGEVFIDGSLRGQFLEIQSHLVDAIKRPVQ